MATQGFLWGAATDEGFGGEVKRAVKDAMRSPMVVVTAMVCVTVVVLAALGLVGWLLYQQRDPTIIVSMMGTVIATVVSLVTYARIRKVEHQTNGHTTRLLDAALKDKE